MVAGFIMSGNTPVAKFSGRTVTPILPAKAPLCFQIGGDLETWLEMRAIDRHRTNSRILKRVLRLGDTSDLNTVLRVHGATITDNYWVKTGEEESIRWEDIRFSKNYFSDIALRGTIDTFAHRYTPEQLRTPTPELTNTGSYEKCWRLIDDRWVMMKQGSVNELFSEAFVAELGKRLGFPMAEYQVVDGCVSSPDFTGGRLNFEPMAYLTGEDEDYETNYKALQLLKPGLELEYLDILFMDALVLNVDRHTQNFGILRDRETGEILSMAPNFDNNLALISRGYAKDPLHVSNILIDMFRDLLEGEDIAYKFPNLEETMVREVANGIMPEADIDREYVVKFVISNYQKLLH